MWDYVVGLVRITPFFKACDYAKGTTPPLFSLSILTVFRPSLLKPFPQTLDSRNSPIQSPAALWQHKATGSRLHVLELSALPFAGTFAGHSRQSSAHRSSRNAFREVQKASVASRLTRKSCDARHSKQKLGGESHRAATEHPRFLTVSRQYQEARQRTMPALISLRLTLRLVLLSTSDIIRIRSLILSHLLCLQRANARPRFRLHPAGPVSTTHLRQSRPSLRHQPLQR